MQNQKPGKWSNDQIEALIDAYKEELCLYATNMARYHNKHLRGEAIFRVYQTMMGVRPTTSTKQCANKFHNLRNQFNIEHAKIKASVKSGTGTDDVSNIIYKCIIFLTAIGLYIVILTEIALNTRYLQHKVSVNYLNNYYFST